MTFEGFASLKTVHDLLEKLKRDREKLVRNHTSADEAFNFFVTALHMLDWLYPNDSAKRKAEEQGEVLLQLCSHIANGAKHFKVTHPKHRSVKGVRPGGLRFGRQSHPGGGLIFGSQYVGLLIELDGDAQAKYGNQITTVRLSAMLIELWEKKLGAAPGASTCEHGTPGGVPSA